MKSAVPHISGTPGTTFFVALWILGIVAAAQLVAVVWKVVPETIVRVAQPAAPEEVVEMAEAYRPAAPADTLPAEERQPAQDSQKVQEAMILMAEADRFIRVGDWENALGAIRNAMEIMDDSPELEYHYAFVLERLGQEQEASQVLADLLARPGLDPTVREEAAKLKDWVDQTIANMEASGVQLPPGITATPIDELPPGPGAPMLEEFGLQPGAALGIVAAREVEDAEDSKKLRVAIKSRPGSPIDSNEVKVTVRFFERGAEGDIFLTQSPVTSEWISPPVDWADNEPEILDVVYPLPEADAEKSYHGYTVAVYYRDELQDTRAVPGELDQMFPHDLFLEP